MLYPRFSLYYDGVTTKIMLRSTVTANAFSNNPIQWQPMKQNDCRYRLTLNYAARRRRGIIKTILEKFELISVSK